MIDKEQQIINLELDIEDAEVELQLGEDLKWLKKQKQFNNVIYSGYINKIAEELFNELTKSINEQSMPEEQLREGLLAIRHLKSYLGFDGQQGDVEYNAEKAKSNIELFQASLDKL